MHSAQCLLIFIPFLENILNSVEVVEQTSGCPRSGKKSGKNIFSRSGNFEICQGILEFKQKSEKSQGILK